MPKKNAFPLRKHSKFQNDLSKHKNKWKKEKEEIWPSKLTQTHIIFFSKCFARHDQILLNMVAFT